jgi:hypothetical protein
VPLVPFLLVVTDITLTPQFLLLPPSVLLVDLIAESVPPPLLLVVPSLVLPVLK